VNFLTIFTPLFSNAPQHKINRFRTPANDKFSDDYELEGERLIAPPAFRLRQAYAGSEFFPGK